MLSIVPSIPFAPFSEPIEIVGVAISPVRDAVASALPSARILNAPLSSQDMTDVMSVSSVNTAVFSIVPVPSVALKLVPSVVT
mgnify:CR=1 FL=1